MMRNIFKSLTFLTLLAGLLGFVATFYFPSFPLDRAQILSLEVFVLGLIGIYPTLRAQGLRALLTPPIFNSLAFWQLVAGLLAFILVTVAPGAPVTREMILGVILTLLALFGIHPELRARGLI